MTETKITRGEIFKKLSSIDVSKFVEQKMGLKYLSWANAWAIMMNNYPTATYEFKEFPEYVQCAANKWEATGRTVDYRITPAGCEVTAIVHIEGNDYQMSLYVMDFRNKPVFKPDYSQINKTQQRALVKALALAGLGLNLYQGEDLPTDKNIKKTSTTNEQNQQKTKTKQQQQSNEKQTQQSIEKQTQQSNEQLIENEKQKFDELKQKLMQQKRLSEQEIVNIAAQGANGATNTLQHLKAGNEALKKKLGEK